jgi:ubiquinone/menaquinone biosynthesis C-methylase UbiE
MKKKFEYGDVLGEVSDFFRKDLHDRIELKKLFKDRKLLDLGCGYGADTQSFSAYARSVVGVDLDYHKTWEKIKNKKIRFVQSPSEKLPFRNGDFQAIYLKDLLHHVDDVEKTLKETKRISSDDVNIVIIEGNRYNPLFYFLVTKLKGHEHFSRSKFKSLVLKYYPNANFFSLEAYPPFFLGLKQYKFLVSIEKIIEKLKFLSPFFSYNVAVIKGKKIN